MEVRRAFTLIELLIVVTIIAILAAIALPNFLEAQTRAKVARVKGDHRTMMIALEAYRLDHGNLPPSIPQAIFKEFAPLTTPISYISSIPYEPFIAHSRSFRRQWHNTYDYCRFWQKLDPPTVLYTGKPWDRHPASHHALVSVGPDLRAQIWYLNETSNGFLFSRILYDPTNGTRSAGDILTFGTGSQWR